MKIPNKLKIGNLMYTVGSLEESEATHYGKGSMFEQKIWLGKKFCSKDKKIETFLHEIVHQLFDQGRFEKESSDEKLVDCIAVGMYQVFKDNNLLK